MSELKGIPELERLRVVLVKSRNPLNIGAAARAMSNFGFRHLRVVTPYAPAFREARSAVGAGELLQQAVEYESVGEAVSDCALVVGTTAVRHRVLQQRLEVLEDGARLIRRKLAAGASGKVALLFGSERVGLSNEELSHCHWLMRIPTAEENISMNLGQAVAVCLYEIACGEMNTVEKNAGAEKRSAERDPNDIDRSATGEEVERMTELLNEALRESDYPGPAASNEMKVRRLVRRMGLSALDAEVWQGILRQMLWKMRAAKNPPE
ncbi:MAG TPA: TrmJ/YjtD family RNA methyltransferase [Candidatus Acidoferrales bacterium]|jgi:tRNA/rRNA methyltransferase|nr:TrmJ/YjtD family RNA methyltransferase [Candidatus Acidoferrales bacterium]